MKRKASFAALAAILWSATLLPITGGSAASAAPLVPAAEAAATPCTNGMAGNYPCRNVDLQSVLPLSSMGGGSGAGGWGWTDPSNNKEYAIVARSNGTAFVDITNPTAPVYIGNLPSPTGTSSWRELNVYNNTVYVVADNNGSHGLQVFDLTKLRSVTSPPVTFTADARDTSFTEGHTVSVNPESGYLYVNGTNTCSGGPRMFNLANRLAPAFAGCVSADGYSHDSTTVNYHGPDSRYTGKEILVGSNEDSVTVFDVTTKSSPVQLARKTYAGSGYTHQGWFTEDHKYFLVDDETDETSNGHNTYTYVWDMSSLTNPVLTGKFVGPTAASDHNQYIKGNYSYQANYKAGLRIIDVTNAANPANMSEAAYFDTYPANNTNGFTGAWNNYPYYPSGNVAVFTIDGGLFVVKPNLGTPANDFSLAVSPTAGAADPGGLVTTTVSTAVTSGTAETVTLSATGLPSGATASFSPASVTAGGSSTLTIATSASTPPGSYPVTVKGTAPSGSKTTTYALTVNGPSGGCSGTNANDVAIPDNSTVESAIAISGCSGNASAGSTVEVHIQHTYIGDLAVNLVAPDGTAYVLHNRTGSGTDNIDKTYTVDLSGEATNGTWKLRVRDAATLDTGKIDTWTLNLGTAPPPPGCSGTNGDNVTIPDNSTVTSQITLSGCTGNASATSTVAVKIQHTYIGDLVVSLVAADGSAYVLHNRTGSGTDNIDKTYTANLSSEVRNGTWTLRVQDAAADDTGLIDSWTLTL